MQISELVKFLPPEMIMSQLVGSFLLKTIYCLLFAFLLTCIGLPFVIKIFKFRNIGQVVRDDGPQRHLAKSGTPIMGGLVMVFAVWVSSLIFVNWSVSEVWITLLTLLGFTLIGLADDWSKLSSRKKKGLSSKMKLVLQSLLTVLIITGLYFTSFGGESHALYIPFLSQVTFSLGIFYPVLLFIMLVGTSNAVNLTDGLDGLAIVPSIFVFLGFMFIIFISVFFNLSFIGVVNSEKLTSISYILSSLVGSGLAFLWFNCYPAKIFMGDSGSLALGAVMGLFAALLHQELLLILLGGVFVLETLSVMIQVISYRSTGKRVFKMAPLHHHFELLGWSETTVIIRFWIIAALCLILSILAMFC